MYFTQKELRAILNLLEAATNLSTSENRNQHRFFDLRERLKASTNGDIWFIKLCELLNKVESLVEF